MASPRRPVPAACCRTVRETTAPAPAAVVVEHVSGSAGTAVSDAAVDDLGPGAAGRGSVRAAAGTAARADDDSRRAGRAAGCRGTAARARDGRSLAATRRPCLTRPSRGRCCVTPGTRCPVPATCRCSERRRRSDRRRRWSGCACAVRPRSSRGDGSAAPLGGGLAGGIAGLVGGVLLALAPGSTAPLTVAPVLAVDRDTVRPRGWRRRGRRALGGRSVGALGRRPAQRSSPAAR